MAEEIRWGILGTGSIAKKFAQGLMSAEGANLVAVGSRSQQTAATFADLFSVPSRYSSRLSTIELKKNSPSSSALKRNANCACRLLQTVWSQRAEALEHN